jgi:N-acetylglucosamine-6-sulfatase
MRRALTALAVLAAVTLAGSGSRAPADVAARPNFVVVMADDQTIGEMGVMKQTLHRIGGEGVSFDRFYDSFPLCCPSRTTFLTGQYSHNHGVLGNGTPVGGYYDLRKQDTLGVWLQSAGYHTIHIGKFLNRYGTRDPTEVPPGWDEWYAALQSSSDRYFDYKLNENGALHHYGRAAADYKTDVETEKAVSAIHRRAELGASGQPFFLFLGAIAPHLPATPAPRHRGLFRHLRLPRGSAFNERDVSDKPRFIRRLPRLSEQEIRRITASYRDRAASLLSLDEGIGRILDELGSDGMQQDTYVVFVSDNGFFFGQHRLPKGKYLPYEPASRLPLMIRGPGIAAGQHSDELVANVDLAPTILGLAGATPSVSVDGRSLMPFAEDPARRTGRPILFEANSADDPSIGIPYTGIRTDRYAYISYRDGEHELYDLARDPRELRSRDRDPRYAATRQALAAALPGLRDCAGESCRAQLGGIPGPAAGA